MHTTPKQSTSNVTNTDPLLSSDECLESRRAGCGLTICGLQQNQTTARLFTLVIASTQNSQHSQQAFRDVPKRAPPEATKAQPQHHRHVTIYALATASILNDSRPTPRSTVDFEWVGPHNRVGAGREAWTQWSRR